jgi:hypothetical protein
LLNAGLQAFQASRAGPGSLVKVIECLEEVGERPVVSLSGGIGGLFHYPGAIAPDQLPQDERFILV